MSEEKKANGLIHSNVLRVDGEEFTLSPLTAGMAMRMEKEASFRMSEVEQVRPHVAGFPPEIAAKMVADAREADRQFQADLRSDDPEVATQAGAEWQRRYERWCQRHDGVAFGLWLLAMPNHPTIRLEEVERWLMVVPEDDLQTVLKSETPQAEDAEENPTEAQSQGQPIGEK